jgi:hypothetical protein
MAFIPVPFGVKVVIEYQIGGKPAINVFFVIADHEIEIADLTDIAEIVRSSWVGGILPNLSNELSLMSVTATDVSKADGGQVINMTDLPATGGVAQPAAPNQVAAVLSLRSGYTGRSNRGRLYLPGIPENVAGQTELGSAFRTAIAGQFQAMKASLVGEGYTPVIASFQHLGVPRTTAVVQPISNQFVSAGIATQRRRLK